MEFQKVTQYTDVQTLLVQKKKEGREGKEASHVF